MIGSIPSTGTAEEEGRRLGRYLLGAEPGPAVLAAYAHPRTSGHVGAARDDLDRALLRWATAHPFLARGADLYARLLRPDALLRRKLICLLALAEVHGSEAPIYTATVGAGVWRFGLGAAAKGLASAVSLLLALPVFASVRVLQALRRSR